METGTLFLYSYTRILPFYGNDQIAWKDTMSRLGVWLLESKASSLLSSAVVLPSPIPLSSTCTQDTALHLFIHIPPLHCHFEGPSPEKGG